VEKILTPAQAIGFCQGKDLHPEIQMAHSAIIIALYALSKAYDYFFPATTKLVAQ